MCALKLVELEVAEPPQGAGGAGSAEPPQGAGAVMAF